MGVLLVLLFGGGAWYLRSWQPDLWGRLWPGAARMEGSGGTQREGVRGTIYDRNYRELAVSYERVSVYANTREISSLVEVIEPLANVLQESFGDLSARFSSGNPRIWLARDISQEQEQAIDDLALPGIYLHREYVRYYPEKESTAHLVGFVERDTGLAGIEQFFNSLETKYRLGGPQTEDLQLLADGQPGADGRHLILTIDLKIQALLNDYLAAFSELDPGCKRGALVMEADTGAIIGYAQTPSFDSNRFHTYPEEVFSDVFNEMMAAPEPFKRFLRETSLLVSQSEESQTLLPWSIAAEKRKLGVQLQLWEKLGAAGRETYDFQGSVGDISERVPFAPPFSPAADYETVPVMQTPLQILTSITRTVNGGTKITPHAADRLILRHNQSEYLLESFPQVPARPLLPVEVSEEARRIFQAMGRSGSLDASILSGVSTSYKMNGGMNSLRRHYLVVTLVPAEQPELVLLIAGSDPGYLTESDQSVDPLAGVDPLIAPVVALQRVMKNLADMMRPRDQAGVNYRALAGENDTPSSAEPRSPVAAGTPAMTMPDLSGMSLRKSIRILQGAGVSITVDGSGRVVFQEPAVGTPLLPDMTVRLTLKQDEVDTQ